MRVLRTHRAFARVWLAGLCFLLATWALHAVMLMRVFDLTGSPFATGLIPVFASVPGILLGPLAGSFVDRHDRRKVMAGCALALAVVLVAMVPIARHGGVEVLFGIIAVEAAVVAFFSPAENALLPTLVPDDDLGPANALNGLNDSLGRIMGPAIGTWTLVTFGFTATLISCAVLYVFGWGVLPRIVDRLHHDPAGAANGVWATFREGIAIVRAIPVLALMVAIWALAMVADVPLSAVLPAFMRESVGVSAEFFGNSMSVRGLTGLVGGFVVVALSRRVAPERLLAYGLLGQGASYFLLGAANDPLWSVLVLVPIGPSAAAIGTGLTTLLQRASPEAVRGRVFALSYMVNGLVVLVVSFTSGSIGEVVGSRPIVMTAGLLHLLPMAVVVFVLGRRLRTA